VHADFDQIVRQHQRRIYRVLLGMLRDSDAAETLTQECFLRAYRHRKGFRGDSSVETWLMRIAINLARDHVKSRRRAFWARLFDWRTQDPEREAHLLEVAGDAPSPERVLAAREQVAAVRVVVDKLPARQREVFVLRFVEEMTLEEIAQETGAELGTVKSHLHRAVAAVRSRIKSEEKI
jgi:RNA polymerase sigma-70 factor (ECF subfamily)